MSETKPMTPREQAAILREMAAKKRIEARMPANHQEFVTLVLADAAALEAGAQALDAGQSSQQEIERLKEAIECANTTYAELRTIFWESAKEQAAATGRSEAKESSLHSISPAPPVDPPGRKDHP